MKIKDIMCAEIECIDPDMTLQDAAQMMRGDDIGCLPVIDGREIVGMITDRDIVCRAVAEGLDMTITPVYRVMTENVTSCMDNQDLEVVATMMEEKHIRRMPVLDHETREPIGLLSLGDISDRCPPELLKELMGCVAGHHGPH